MNLIKRPRSAYTLIEISVVLAVVAVLLGLGVFGISILQSNGRDTQRKAKLAEINSAIDYYLRIYNRIPSVGGGFQWVGNNQIVVGPKTVNLSGALVRSATNVSDIDETYYIYQIPPVVGGYQLCVRLENGNWFNLGTNPVLCS